MMERVLDVESQEVITRDNAMVKVDGIAFFQVVDAAKAAYEINNLENAILTLTMTNIRTVMGSMDLDSLLSQARRDQPSPVERGRPGGAMAWGVKMNRIDIKDIAPPRDLVNLDGAADEGRARQACGDSRGRGAAAGRHSAGRRREAVRST